VSVLQAFLFIFLLIYELYNSDLNTIPFKTKREGKVFLLFYAFL